MKDFQLRRIGLSPSIKALKDVYRIEHDTTIIGRGAVADIFLDSNIRKGLISRAHAQIIRKKANETYLYEIFDTSLNGSYVNDYRIKGSHILNEGDIIAFGHLQGSLLEPGTLAPQKDTEFLFRFESCKNVAEKTLAGFVSNHQQSTTSHMSPTRNTNKNQQETLPLEASIKTCSVLSVNTSDKENSMIQDDLTSLVEKVTSTINSNTDSLNDSFTINEYEKNLKEPEDMSSIANKPLHPRDKFLLSVQYSDTPSSVTSSDNDIKRDTSLNVKHAKKKNQRTIKTTNEKNNSTTNPGRDEKNSPTMKPGGKNKLKKVLEDHDVGRRLHDDVHTTTESETADSETNSQSEMNCASNHSESEHSLEVTDSSSDSDFMPVASPLKKRSISQRKKSLDINSDNKLPSKRKKGVYTHDKCAAWDCKKPSGAIKKITWVQCDDCDQWYHVSCSGLNPREANRKDTNFYCGC